MAASSMSGLIGPPVLVGCVAMSIALKPERAVGGTLRSGDRVGIVATSNAGRPDASSVLLFQKIPIVGHKHPIRGAKAIFIC